MKDTQYNPLPSKDDDTDEKENIVGEADGDAIPDVITASEAPKTCIEMLCENKVLVLVITCVITALVAAATDILT